MKFTPVTRLDVRYEAQEGESVRVGGLGARRGQVLFEYDAAFLESGLELSPFKLPLKGGVTTGDPARFDGLMGVFDDSLPDGWGRLLIDRRAAKAGIDPQAMGPLDRLSLIGARSMGALIYEPQVELEPPSVVSLPEIAADARAVLKSARAPDLDRLIALGGSPQGARPKALVQLSKDGAIIYGSRTHLPGATPWLVKFPAIDDDPHAGALELAYSLMAKAAGIEMPEAKLLCRTRKMPGYFASKRFDRDGTRKVHMLTVAGLLHAPHTSPSMTYAGLLLATRRLTRDESAVSAMFRRACFNVLAHNRDDHTRNFAFLMSERGEWRLSPAYDLTLSSGLGGEHATLIPGAGRDPTRADLEALARSVSIKRPRAIIDAVRAAVSKLTKYADAAGLPRKLATRAARQLRVK